MGVGVGLAVTVGEALGGALGPSWGPAADWHPARASTRAPAAATPVGKTHRRRRVVTVVAMPVPVIGSCARPRGV
ncbi:hypothetical protein ASG23_15400 [Cellulomonas sp. Leaf395]|nr:hypothetical protein ASG23_15400 [Cellulomonas sp. Leaf395]